MIGALLDLPTHVLNRLAAELEMSALPPKNDLMQSSTVSPRKRSRRLWIGKAAEELGAGGLGTDTALGKTTPARLTRVKRAGVTIG